MWVIDIGYNKVRGLLSLCFLVVLGACLFVFIKQALLLDTGGYGDARDDA